MSVREYLSFLRGFKGLLKLPTQQQSTSLINMGKDWKLKSLCGWLWWHCGFYLDRLDKILLSVLSSLFCCWFGGLYLRGGCWLSRMVAMDVPDSSPKSSATLGANPAQWDGSGLTSFPLSLCQVCVTGTEHQQRDHSSQASVRLLTPRAQLGYGDPSAQFCSVSRSSWRKLSALTNCCYLVPGLPHQVF